MAKRDEPGWGRSTIDIHRFLFDYGFADEVFLLEHTHGAEQLRARAAEWTFDRAAAGADVDPELLERVAEMYAETSPAMIRFGWVLERNRNDGNAEMAAWPSPRSPGSSA